MSNEFELEQVWEDGLNLKMDEFIRTLLTQMFESDNGTSYIVADMGEGDKATKVELKVEIVSINGIQADDKEHS
jgi:hypothetical protein